MGWNSWNYFGKNSIDEKLIREVIDAMATQKLNELGYNYIVVDGGWRDSTLGPNGELLVNNKFPSGMKALANYAHSKGFKFGLHTVPGSHDCGCDPVGGWGNEKVQVQQFVDWGLDFVKLDRCRFSLDPHPEGHPRKDPIWYSGWDKQGENIQKAYALWSKLLQEANRDMILSASAYRYYDWYPTLTNMGRTTGDIATAQTSGASFDNGKKNSVMAISVLNNESRLLAGNGYWNDPDMLVVGEKSLTNAEQRSHFALWCIMSSPLFLGNDPRNMTKEEIDIITNKTAIQINQDDTEQGRRIIMDDDTEVWLKRLKDGKYGALLLNRDKKQSHMIKLTSLMLDGHRSFQVRDVYDGKKLEKMNDGYEQNIEPGSGLFLILEP
ncbi:hypothetical protein A5893_05110 [Pedobacter psychrophilus]|uniref:Alpha-galactosidase n=2 Tax=Pedobacter psychrophilus TaxID=1826909 RepID=A0A179DIR3_9SPHI|nr:hypothetical protein A5893_05110 [Pedobacter psychrophilus]